MEQTERQYLSKDETTSKGLESADSSFQRKLYKKNSRKKNLTGYLMVLPPFVGFFAFTFLPMIVSLLLSFMDLHSTMLEYSVWVGFDNYIRIFTSETFYQALGNTLYYCCGVFVNIALALFLTHVLTSYDVVGNRVARIILFLPQVCSTVAMSVMWTWIFNEDYGVINQVLGIVDFKFAPYTDSTHFMPSIFIMGLWRDGVNIILLQSALVNVNKSLQEAAAIDGANRFQVFWEITFPAVLPTLFYILITCLVTASQEAALFQIVTSGGRGPGGAGVTVAYYIYRMVNAGLATEGYGLSSALSWVFAVMIILITRLLFWLNDKFVCYD